MAPLTGVTCAKCGRDDCTIYPFPLPEGTMVCPSCSPGWLRDFLEFCMREEGDNG